ncbi:MAG: VWA domain-containing protein [Pseudomonadota bacterium]
MHRHPARSPLLWTTVFGLGLALACTGGTYDHSGSAGWGDESRTGEDHSSDDTGAQEEPQDTSRADTADSAWIDTAVEEVCDDENPVILYLSPDDSNSMSSAAQARAAVLGGWGDLAYVHIRGWEFLNYYDFAYPPAAEGELAVHLDLMPMEEGNDEDWLLQIAVSSPTEDWNDRPFMNLTFVVDTSGSMTGEPIELAREILLATDAALRPGDYVSVVTWNTTQNVVLANHLYTGPLDRSLENAAGSLIASGATDLYSGLVKGYELARASFSAERINRVVLVSDGGANVGVTSLDLIGEQADDQDEDGIYLVGAGVGSPSTYFDALMDAVTDAGKGASVFIDSTDEAHRIFEERFVNTFGVAGRDVQLQLVLPPGMEIVHFSGEGYSADPSEIDPQHIAPNDAMVFYNQLHTCAPDLLEDFAPVQVTVRWEDVMTREPREAGLRGTWGQLLAAEHDLLLKGRAIDAYAGALEQLAGVYSPPAREDILAGARTALTDAEAANPGDTDLAEVRSVLEALGLEPVALSSWQRLSRAARRTQILTAWEERGLGGR